MDSKNITFPQTLLFRLLPLFFCVANLAHAQPDASAYSPHAIVDSRGFVDVWKLREDVAAAERFYAVDHSESCSYEGDESEEDSTIRLSAAQKRKLMADARKEEQRELACIQENLQAVKRYQDVRAKFNAAWLKTMLAAVKNGDKVAEVILLNCETSEIIDRTNIVSTCSEPKAAEKARRRLVQIGFKPAIPFDQRLIPEGSGNGDQILKVQDAVLREIRNGRVVSSDAAARVALHHSVSGDDKRSLDLRFRIARNAALIVAAFQNFPRAFGFCDLSYYCPSDEQLKLRLNRVAFEHRSLTWGPGMVDTDSGYVRNEGYYRTSPSYSYFCRRLKEKNGQPACSEWVFGNHPSHAGEPPGIKMMLPFPLVRDPKFEEDLLVLLRDGEASIQNYLQQDPRWEVFLVERVSHHQFVPAKVSVKSQKLADAWIGTWQLVKNFKFQSSEWRFLGVPLPLEAKISGILQIQHNQDGVAATVSTQNVSAASPPDVVNCPLRYSGGSSMPGGRIGRINNFTGRMSIPKIGIVDNSQGDIDSLQYPPGLFAPFDQKKRYRQVLMTCRGGEMLDSDQVRFLLLAENTVVEVSTAGMLNFPLIIRHYQRVSGANVTPLQIDSENF